MVAMVMSGISSGREGCHLGYFVEELWSRFGPTDCEDFDEALSKIEQKGSLRDYQK